jgi:ABC-type long-subunit fatty acid transport system fused permease/ATPase subunit
VAQYVERFPLLSWLLKEEPMNEFTQKHEDPEVGVFYSRLSTDLLKQTDEVQGDHYAQVLRDWRDKDYSQFLSMHNPLIHPFLYEMRVHIFRRDKKEEEAKKARNERARRGALFVSYKENLILEKYFTVALRKSSYAWSPEKKKNIEALVDKAKPYRSPVSAGFFRITEKTVWLTIILILIALAVVNYFISSVFFPKYRR